MSNRKPTGIQVDTINRNASYVQPSFDLRKQDQFVTSFAVDFKHYKAMPSPIGKNDRGDYRRNDAVDTITSNGMIYTCAGVFSATMTDNSREQRRQEGGVVDPAQSRLVMPRYYNKVGLADGDTIYLAPGDRLYIADPNADAKVPNYQEMDYVPGEPSVPMFPIAVLDGPIIDSRNQTYTPGVDFVIDKCGNIQWLPDGKNPGINPDTGKGRIFSVRYLYNAFWYVHSMPKEVRLTNVTTGGVRSPQRMPSYALILREYVFHNQNNNDKKNNNPRPTPSRQVQEPIENIDPAKGEIVVDMSGFESVVEAEE
jgi:hypothetical protein